MTSKLHTFRLTRRLFLMYFLKGLIECQNPNCLRGSLKIGDYVISRMVSSGYGGKFRIPEHSPTLKIQRTRRVLYHYWCAEEMNLI